MKKLYTLLIIALMSLSTFAQSEDCFESYKKVFENRGADEVNDGVHTDIILSNRSKDGSDCYLCSATVKNGVIVGIAIYFEDGTKEDVMFEFKDKADWTVYNGISRTKVTTKDEQINLLFIDKIKPKKKPYKKAPLPKFDLN